MFNSILTTMGTTTSSIVICLLASLAAGLILACSYKAVEHPTKSFSITAAMLPAIVMAVIMMVNGNLGVGVAVAGSFSLVRFRSMPGKASDILIIFMAMACGLCTGMGYVLFAISLAVILSLFYLLFAKMPILDGDRNYRSIRITIPEDLEYNTVFADIFAEYTKKADLQSIRTVNLGTMYQITYDVELKNTDDEKKMLDMIRTRNGNLSVISSRTATLTETL